MSLVVDRRPVTINRTYRLVAVVRVLRIARSRCGDREAQVPRGTSAGICRETHTFSGSPFGESVPEQSQGSAAIDHGVLALQWTGRSPRLRCHPARHGAETARRVRVKQQVHCPPW